MENFWKNAANVLLMFVLAAALVGAVWSLVVLGKAGQWFPFIGTILLIGMAAPCGVTIVKRLLGR